MTKRPPLSLIALFVIVGFLLVVTGTATSAASDAQEPRRQALIDQILDRRQTVGDLDQAVAELRGEVDTARDSAGAQSEESSQQQREQAQLAQLAGTTALKGDGVVVEVGDAPRSSEADATKFDSSRIQDSDLQLLVNALFATGAEAVAINDNRVVAVTPIRAAGGTIVVNYRPVASPYRISAIGVNAKDFESTDIASHFRQWRDKFNLSFDVKHSRNVEVPAYSGRVAGTLAVPVTQPSAGPAQEKTTTTGSGR